MKKSQWYVVSGAMFLIMLIFTWLAKVRKTNCMIWFPSLDSWFSACMQRHSAFVVIAFIFLILTIVFLIIGLFEKSGR